MSKDTLTLKLHIQDAQFIIGALEERPYNQVAKLITEIRLQAKEQLEGREAEVAETTAPVPVAEDLPPTPKDAVTNEGVALPAWKCHKIVWASKISALEIGEDQSAIVATEHGIIDVPAGWAGRFHGTEDDRGYLVVYRDDYVSWSPTTSLEEGYARITE